MRSPHLSRALRRAALLCLALSLLLCALILDHAAAGPGPLFALAALGHRVTPGTVAALLLALGAGLGMVGVASTPEQAQLEDQVRNGTASFGALQVTTLTGTVTLPNRPTALVAANPTNYRTAQPTVAQEFVVTLSGNLSGAETLVLPLGTSANGWLPGDIVNVQASGTQTASHALTVQDGGSGTPTLGVISDPPSWGSVRAQLNQTNTHWNFLSGGTV